MKQKIIKYTGLNKKQALIPLALLVGTFSWYILTLNKNVLTNIKYKLALIFGLTIILALGIKLTYIDQDNDLKKYSKKTWLKPWQKIKLIIGIILIYIPMQLPPGHSNIQLILGIAALGITASACLGLDLRIRKQTPHRWFKKKSRFIGQIIINVLLINIGDIVIGGIRERFSEKIQTSNNQNEINTIISSTWQNKTWIVIFAVIIAPIIEETIFRQIIIGPNKDHGIKYSTQKRIALAIFGALLFGAMHMTSQITQINKLPVMLEFAEYAWTGGILSYEFYRHNDIFENIISHGTYNALTMLILLIAF